MDKTTKLEINEHYGDSIEALEDNGYEEVKDGVFSKKGKNYKVVHVESFNTWIYNITLEEVE